RRRDIIGVVPSKNKGSITASVDSLGDVEPVRIEIMKAAGVDSWIDPGKVDVSSRQGRVSSGGKASAISDGAVDRGIAIGAPVVRGRGGIGHACCHDVVDGLGDDTIGKHRLIKIGDIVADNVASEALLNRRIFREAGNAGQGPDVISESNGSSEGSGKTNFCTRRRFVP